MTANAPATSPVALAAAELAEIAGMQDCLQTLQSIGWTLVGAKPAKGLSRAELVRTSKPQRALDMLFEYSGPGRPVLLAVVHGPRRGAELSWATECDSLWPPDRHIGWPLGGHQLGQRALIRALEQAGRSLEPSSRTGPVQLLLPRGSSRR